MRIGLHAPRGVYFKRGDMHSIVIGIFGWRFFLRGNRVNTPSAEQCRYAGGIFLEGGIFKRIASTIEGSI